MAKKKIKDTNNSCLIYYILITAFFLLSNYIVKFSFELNGTSIYYSVFTIPFVYLFTYLAYRKCGFKKALTAIIISVIVQLLVFFGEWLITSEINMSVLVGTMVSVPVSELICIGLCKLVKGKFENIFSIFIILAVAVIQDNFTFLSIVKAFENSKLAFNLFNLSMLIKLIMAFISSIIIVFTIKKK